MLTSVVIILTVNLWSDQTISLTLAVWLPMLLMVICCTSHFQQGFCLQKTYCASERLVLLTLHHLQRPTVVFSMCCGGNVTEFNTKKDGTPLCDVLSFHFHDKVHKHVLTCHTPTPHWGTAKPCHCNWGWRKDQGERLSVLAGCSTVSTARRKSISLLYCHTMHVIFTSHRIYFSRLLEIACCKF
jgi:hypothetical protein